MTHKDAWIRTYTGGKAYFFEPEKSTIVLEDVAHALSLLCRFNGACRHFYSVAQHSILVADNIYEETSNKNLAFQGLCHDFSEAFISDIPSPFKQFFPEYKIAEKRMEEWLAQEFGYEYPHDPIVKKHDLRALSTEMRDLMNGADYSLLPKPYEETLYTMNCFDSKYYLLEKFNFYSP